MITKKFLLVVMIVGLLTAGPLPGLSATESEVETVIDGLDTVWEMAWGPQGELYMTERRGNLLVWHENEVKQIAKLPVVERGESGLMGMALDPEYEDNNLMYVCFTRRNEGSLENVVERFRVVDNTITDREILLDGMNATTIHNGCRLEFDTAGKLLVTMGDSARGSLAQDMDSLNGKVLRIDKNGNIPEDNPFPGSPVFTLGHRNPQGIDIRPGTDEIYISEHGPAANDEVNRLIPGRNYGWPQVGGTVNTEEFEPALWAWTPTIAPAGISFHGPDKLYLATLKQSKLHRLKLNKAGEITEDQTVLSGYGRLRAVTQGPDGDCVYISTSNRDGRGDPEKK